jgi:hypothetical protein
VSKDPAIEAIAERLVSKGYASLAHDLRSVWPRVNEVALVGIKSEPTTEWSAAERGEGPGLGALFVMMLQTIMFVLVAYIAYNVTK